jgi:nicotinamide mononucleotide transporter
MYFILSRLTDSPVPAADSFVTSLSVIATWMLARKIYEHWYLWVIVNSVSCILFITRDLYATVVLYAIYCTMSVAGLREWRKSL